MNRSRFCSLAGLVFFSVISCGCEADYYAHLVAGELESLCRTVPVAEALNDPNLTQEEHDKLVLTQQVRQFGIDTIGLYAGSAYTVFEANGSEPAAYVLSASAKEVFRPYEWNFWFVGPSVSKGFFDRRMGQREADDLAGQGYDVYYARVDGFSTLGILPDPVRQSNLQLDDLELAELILHEMTHSTVFKLADINFSESVATFVGRSAAQAWFDAAFGADSDEAQAARLRFADKRVIDEYVNELFTTMAAYYAEAAAAGTPRETILVEREARFTIMTARFADVYQPRLDDPERWSYISRLAVNNAMILTAMRYQGGLSDYQAVFDQLGGDFPRTLAVFKAAAARPDSRGYLRDWAADP